MLLKNMVIPGVMERAGWRKPTSVLDAVVYILLFLFVILSFRYQYLLLNYKEWGDESETIVAAKMMAAGMRLYSEIFNHHGPLTFLPGVLTEEFGDFGVFGHRVPIALLQVLAILSIYKSPALRFESQRILASVVSATLVLVFMPNIFGHMYKYQTLAGILLVVVLSQYAIPAILCPEKVSSWRAVSGSFLIVSLPFLAISYLLTAALIFIASCRRDYFKCVAIGASLGLAANLLFLGVYGSFAGFLAFHLYLNAKVLPLYTGLQPGRELIVNALRTAVSDLPHFLSLIVILLSALILAQKEKRLPWRTLLLVAGLISLLMRGAGFHGMPYFYAVLPLLALSFSLLGTNSRVSKQVVLCFLMVCVVEISLILPGDRKKITSERIPTETEFSRLVAELTDQEDRIIAYSFNNFEYLASGRLPASGHFFYLPWQEKYNENPKFGISIDACKQIKEVAPKVMLINKWKVWDRFPWDSYATCIQSILDSNYRQIPDKPYYVRNDLFYKVVGSSIHPDYHETKGIRCEGSIDAVGGASPQAQAIDVHGVIPVHGWLAHSTQAGELNDKTFLTITDDRGNTSFISTRKETRGDVAAAFHKEVLANSGYTTLIDTSTLSEKSKLGLAALKDSVLYKCEQFEVDLNSTQSPLETEVKARDPFVDAVNSSLPKHTEIKKIQCEGHIDTVAGISSPSRSVDVSGVFPIRGWLAHSTQAGELYDKIFLTITDEKGSTSFISTQMEARGDVAAVFHKDNLANAGYEAQVDSSAFNGKAKLGLAALKDSVLYKCEQLELDLNPTQ